MTFNLPKIIRAAVSAASVAMLFAVAAPAANASLVYDNLGSVQDGSDSIYSYGPLANSFTTGNSGGSLVGIQALLMNLSTAYKGTVQATLHADNNHTVGTTLASLGSVSLDDIATDGFASYAFNPDAAFALAANTTYWVELMASGPSAVDWSWSNDLTAAGVAGQFNYSREFGVNSNSDFGAYQMAVELPEPGSILLVALALGMVTVVTTRRKNG
jgi:hypothetical protein